MNEQRRKTHGTKHGLHPALPVVLAFMGITIVSGAFGMLIFPIFAQVCADDLLVAVAKVGYAGLGVLAIALILEAYNLYEHHKQHVAALVIGGFIGLFMTGLLIQMASSGLICG